MGGVGGVYAASRSDGGARGGTGLGGGTGLMEGYSYLGMGSGRMLVSARGFALVGGLVFPFFREGRCVTETPSVTTKILEGGVR